MFLYCLVDWLNHPQIVTEEDVFFHTVYCVYDVNVGTSKCFVISMLILLPLSIFSAV